MDQNTERVRLLLALSIAGLLFSGYLSSYRFFSDTCAFNEPCPYFLGYPACYYGFAMFLIMTLVLRIILSAQFRAPARLASCLGFPASAFSLPDTSRSANYRASFPKAFPRTSSDSQPAPTASSSTSRFSLSHSGRDHLALSNRRFSGIVTRIAGSHDDFVRYCRVV